MAYQISYPTFEGDFDSPVSVEAVATWLGVTMGDVFDVVRFSEGLLRGYEEGEAPAQLEIILPPGSDPCRADTREVHHLNSDTFELIERVVVFSRILQCSVYDAAYLVAAGGSAELDSDGIIEIDFAGEIAAIADRLDVSVSDVTAFYADAAFEPTGMDGATADSPWNARVFRQIPARPWRDELSASQVSAGASTVDLVAVAADLDITFGAQPGEVSRFWRLLDLFETYVSDSEGGEGGDGPPMWLLEPFAEPPQPRPATRENASELYRWARLARALDTSLDSLVWTALATGIHPFRVRDGAQTLDEAEFPGNWIEFGTPGVNGSLLAGTERFVNAFERFQDADIEPRSHLTGINLAATDAASTGEMLSLAAALAAYNAELPMHHLDASPAELQGQYLSELRAHLQSRGESVNWTDETIQRLLTESRKPHEFVSADQQPESEAAHQRVHEMLQPIYDDPFWLAWASRFLNGQLSKYTPSQSYLPDPYRVFLQRVVTGGMATSLPENSDNAPVWSSVLETFMTNDLGLGAESSDRLTLKELICGTSTLERHEFEAFTTRVLDSNSLFEDIDWYETFLQSSYETGAAHDFFARRINWLVDELAEAVGWRSAEPAFTYRYIDLVNYCLGAADPAAFYIVNNVLHDMTDYAPELQEGPLDPRIEDLNALFAQHARGAVVQAILGRYPTLDVDNADVVSMYDQLLVDIGVDPATVDDLDATVRGDIVDDDETPADDEVSIGDAVSALVALCLAAATSTGVTEDAADRDDFAMALARRLPTLKRDEAVRFVEFIDAQRIGAVNYTLQAAVQRDLALSVAAEQLSLSETAIRTFLLAPESTYDDLDSEWGDVRERMGDPLALLLSPTWLDLTPTEFLAVEIRDVMRPFSSIVMRTPIPQLLDVTRAQLFHQLSQVPEFYQIRTIGVDPRANESEVGLWPSVLSPYEHPAFKFSSDHLWVAIEVAAEWARLAIRLEDAASRQKFAPAEETALAWLDGLNSFEPLDAYVLVVRDILAEITGLPHERVGAVLNHQWLRGDAETAEFLEHVLSRASRIEALIDILDSLDDEHYSVDQLLSWVSSDEQAEITSELRQASRQKLGSSLWLARSTEIQDSLRVRKRDVLVQELLRYGAARDEDELSSRLLHDVSMDVCADTTRIIEATGAVQRLVNRSQFGLEPHARAARTPIWEQWTWRKRYRVWEANRKVFLYPEQFLNPELRQDKSEIFKAMESALASDELSDATIDSALSGYLEGLEDVASLEVMAMHTYRPDPSLEAHILYIVARTKTEPRRYFWRAREYGLWTPWEEIHEKIGPEQVVPYVVDGTFYLFWPEYQELAEKPAGGSVASQGSVSATDEPGALKPNDVRNVWHVKLHWMRRDGDQWRASNVASDGIIIPHFFPTRSMTLWPPNVTGTDGIAEFHLLVTTDSEYSEDVYYDETIQWWCVNSFDEHDEWMAPRKVASFRWDGRNSNPTLFDLDLAHAKLRAVLPNLPERLAAGSQRTELSAAGKSWIFDFTSGSDLEYEAPNAARSHRLQSGIYVPNTQQTRTRSSSVPGNLAGTGYSVFDIPGVSSESFFTGYIQPIANYLATVLEVPNTDIGPSGDHALRLLALFGVRNQFGGSTYQIPAWPSHVWSRRSYDELTTTMLRYLNSVELNSIFDSVIDPDLTPASFRPTPWMPETNWSYLSIPWSRATMVWLDALIHTDFEYTAISELNKMYLGLYVRTFVDGASPDVKASSAISESDISIISTLQMPGYAGLILKRLNVEIAEFNSNALWNTPQTPIIANELANPLVSRLLPIALAMSSRLHENSSVRPPANSPDAVYQHVAEDAIQPSEAYYTGLLDWPTPGICVDLGYNHGLNDSMGNSRPVFILENLDTAPSVTKQTGNQNSLHLAFAYAEKSWVFDAQWLGGPASVQWYRNELRHGVTSILTGHRIAGNANSQAQQVSAKLRKLVGPKSAELDISSIAEDASSELELLNDTSVNVWDDSKLLYSPIGPYSSYVWEYLYHAPMLIADKLRRAGDFEKALRWLSLVYDPILPAIDVFDEAGEITTVRTPWLMEPLRELAEVRSAVTSGDAEPLETALFGLQGLGAALDDMEDPERDAFNEQINRWMGHPFDPHALATVRQEAYQKYAVTATLDILIDWADSLFAQDTRESIREAAMLYIQAARIAGPRPTAMPAQAAANGLSYETLPSVGDLQLRTESEMAQHQRVDLSLSSVGAFNSDPDGDVLDVGTRLNAFCVPPGDKLFHYWSVLEERLFNIRHCLNIEGMERDLALFAPPIDPAAIIAALAAGVSLSDAISGVYDQAPKFRFTTLLRRAREAASAAQSLGARVLASIEKKDAEALSVLRTEEQLAMLERARATRDIEMQELEKNLEGLDASREVVESRHTFYRDRVRRSELEVSELDHRGNAERFSINSAIMRSIAGTIAQIPAVTAGVAGGFGSPVSVFAIGGPTFSIPPQIAADFLQQKSSDESQAAQEDAIRAGRQRRDEEWDFQRDQAADELKRLDAQTAALKIRMQLKEREMMTDDLRINNAQVVADFYTNKFANKELYSWLVDELGGLHRRAYQLAEGLAKQAERAWQFEVGDETKTFVEPGRWTRRRNGLLSADLLLEDLRRMEQARYDEYEGRGRELQLRKDVSLAFTNPESLHDLKTTGSCDIELPEGIFDLDFPGHYFRRIRSLAISIPCTVGPHSSVNATLSLRRSRYRHKSDIGVDGYGERASGDSRFKYNDRLTDVIATSSALQDTGVLQLEFGGQEYAPFEGAGAVSQWALSMPHDTNNVDFASISDVILHVSYTARNGGSRLAEVARESVIERLRSNDGKFRVGYSLRNDAAQMWDIQRESADIVGTMELGVEIDSDRLPAAFKGYERSASGLELYLIADRPDAVVSITVTGPDGTENVSFNDDVALKATPSEQDPTLFVSKALSDSSIDWSLEGQWTVEIELAEDVSPESLRDVVLIVEAQLGDRIVEGGS